ncbi:MAG: cobalt ECF transporter T component CbiQ [Actinobacteria bacterium]|nr:cobalt ECF transporter T component CbiQ [Actinomycetota bacterium]
MDSQHTHDDNEIHFHDHAHGAVTHRHAHYHQHAHEKAADKKLQEAHRHTHTYSFELYAYADSPIHRLDARTKTIALVALILAVVLTPAAEVWRFGLYFTAITLLYMIAGVPITFGVKRSLIVLPFVLFAGALLVFMPDKPHPETYNLGFARYSITHGGLYTLFNALIKSWLSVLTTILLYSTTPFPKFVKGLELIRVPQVLTMLFSFLYRFMWVLTSEVKTMMRARDARAFGGGRIWHLKIIGQMVGSLFIRSYERAERVYAAMSARGYDGTIKTLEVPAFAARDAVFTVLFFVTLSIILFWRL